MSGATGDRLESWKEIAAYLGRNVRTVQRWERYEGLPVHRHHHLKLGSIYAYRGEIDEWRRHRVADAADASDAILEQTAAEASARPARRIPRAATRTAAAGVPMALVVMLVAFCGDVQGFQRGDLVRITQLSGRGELRDVRVVAVAGDRVVLSDAGLFVNGTSAGGLSPDRWRELSGQRWEQTVPEGYVMVVSGQTRHWGLIPERSLGRQP
jgi:hypothetical protein